MRASFNLATEAWIPVVRMDGSLAEVSIREALGNATAYRQILDPSPLVTLSIHRLLLAILHRNLGPASREEWLGLWRNGWSNGNSDYLDEWQSRFDLFDEERPFYQSADLRVTDLTPVSKLAHELSAGHNAALFDHSADESPVKIAPPEAARLVVASQSYAVGGGKSPTVNFRHATLVPGVAFLVRGETLFRTLMLNLLRPDGDGLPPDSGVDKPCWEMDSRGANGSSRRPNGYIDYLTWQSRAIRLVPLMGEDRVRVAQMAYAQGVEMPRDLNVRDPMFVYVATEKSGLLPLRLDPEREVWRNSAAILGIKRTASIPPLALNWISGFVIDGALDQSLTYNLELYGMAVDRAKIFLWRRETMPLPLRYLSRAELVDALAESMQLAERCGSVLRRSSATLARYLLARSDSRADPQAVSALARSFDVLRPYWAGLEPRFYELVTALAKEAGSPGTEPQAQEDWKSWVRHEARRSFMRCLDGQPASAYAIRASTIAEREFNTRLAEAIRSGM